MGEQMNHWGSIRVRGAREHNLRDVDVDIPKRQITVFTGVSGSGKSSLVFDTIAAESRRLLNETYPAFVQQFMATMPQPEVDDLDNLQAVIAIDQARMGGGPRSTVGTATDSWTLLRLLYARIGDPPVAGAIALSFNDPRGWCPDCEGAGSASAIDLDALLDRDKSLNEGAIDFPNYQVGGWYWALYAKSGFFDPDKPLRDYTEAEWERFLRGPEEKVALSGEGGSMNLTYTGLLDKITKSHLGKDPSQLQKHIRTAVERISTRGTCQACGGARLNAAARASQVEGRSIVDCAAMQISDLAAFIAGIAAPEVAPLQQALVQRLGHFTTMGLGYLTLDRSTSTLSGGESQRVKMVRHLGSSLTDITYVFDEPSIGLHPADVHRMNELLVQLRDKGNTVLVVEHDPEVIGVADHVVDMGPDAGVGGGSIVYQGDVAGLRPADTPTGRAMQVGQQLKVEPRPPTGEVWIRGASLNNLRDVDVAIPAGVLVAITGVAGSGKSSLVRGCLPAAMPDAVVMDQQLPAASSRSTPATYTGILDHVRKAFAKANGVKPSLFSANSEGACPDCKGLGVIYTDLGPYDQVATTCETCEGRRFTDEVLQYRLHGLTIHEVLTTTAAEAIAALPEKSIATRLQALDDVGLGYVALGQPLSTFSGGERQRLKLAVEMAKPAPMYVLDEPTTGLHLRDVDRLIGLLDRFVDAGSTLVVIEHNLDVVARADWVIDMGPGAGHDGGSVLYEGPPAGLLDHPDSVTGRHLNAHLDRVG
ncbi:MAG TPA: excinuclease ABC subunit UvrA [Euzebya sp.]|nr:excinuclease ABC subunit UvrA [Euzebya sp.]